MAEWRAIVDGREVCGALAANATLAEAIREMAGETALKIGCGEGMCGACSVLVDGEIAHACCVPAFRVHGRAIQTAASFADGRIAQAIVSQGGLQCGFCTPGMVVAVHGMPDDVPATADAIRHALGANLCRCTGYGQLVQGAVLGLTALREGREGTL